MRRFLLAVSLLAMLCAAAPAAQAAPEWRQPFVSSADGNAPAVAVDPSGNTYVAYTASDGLKVARRAPGVGFGSPEVVTVAAVPSTQFVAGAAIGVDGAGNVTLAWQQQAGGYNLGLMAARKPAGGGWEQPQVVDPDIHPGRGFALSVGDEGTSAVAYAKGSFGNERLTVALRAPGAPGWNPPESIGSPGSSDSPRVAVGGDGTVAATVGLFGYGPRGFVRPAATGTWGPEEDLDPPMPDSQMHATAPSVAVDDGGGVLVAWTHSLGGGDYRIDTRYRPTGAATTFGAADPLPNLDGSAAGTEFFNGPALAFDPAGNALVVWRQTSSGREDVFAAERPASGSFGAPQAVSTGGRAEYMRLATDSGGSALLVWRGFDGAPAGSAGDTPGPVYASSRPSGGSFAAPTTLTPSSGTAPVVAAGPAGIGIAAWGRNFSGCSQVEAALWNEGPAGPFGAQSQACAGPAPAQPTGTGGGGEPLPRDVKAPRPGLTAASKQRALKTKSITLKLACDEACTAKVSAKVDHKPARKVKKVKSLKLAAKTVKAPAGGKGVTVRFKLSKKQLATVKKMLAKKGKATFTASLVATDAAGNKRKASRKVALTR